MIDISELGSNHPGYFEIDRESEFNWGTTIATVWYALILFDGGTYHRVGYTSAVGSKRKLMEDLKALKGSNFLLLGVWNGERRTSLFVLDPKKAIKELGKVI